MLSFGAQARFVPGCVHGLRQPCWAIAADAAGTDMVDRAQQLRLALQPTLAQAVGDAPQPHAQPGEAGPAQTPRTIHPTRAPAEATLRLFIDLAQVLHAAAGLPFVQCGRLMQRAGAEHPYLLLLPTLTAVASASLKAMLALQRAFNAAPEQLEAATNTLAHQVAALRAAMPAGSNLPHLLRHAWRLGIPTQQVNAGLFQFGQGAHSHWLDSTFTETTSRNAANLARDKHRAAQVLGQLGLPVPQQRSVDSADAAVRSASELGGAVVIKPANLDGGVGVWTHLSSEAAVREAYANARSHSARVLVEQHLPGRDHRLVVFRGELLIAVERVPASVVGDGVQDITALVTAANADPRRSPVRGAPLKPLVLDAEALGLLNNQGLRAPDVPSAGRRVTLRGTANVATGGWPVDVTAQVHPDNRALAIAAARGLRLDLAGIDLLCPDITRSWREVGGGICEVNGQPNIGVLTADHLFDHLLRRLVPMGGRIPIVVVIGTRSPSPGGPSLASAIAAALQQAGHRVGLADQRGIHVDGNTTSSLLRNDFQRCRALLLNRDINCLVTEANDLAQLDTGLPLDRIDLLVADADAALPAADGQDRFGFFLAGEVATLLSASPACTLRAKALGASCSMLEAATPAEVLARAVESVGKPRQA